jgi:hypothetical protein
MKTFACVSLILFIESIAAMAQVLTLSTTSFCEVYAVSHDASGNAFYVGAFGGTVDFEPSDGPGAADTFTASASGFGEGFILSYSAAGAFRYVLRFNNGFPSGVTTDAMGNLYVVGAFLSTVDFDPGPGSATRVGDGDGDGFLASYTNAGAYRFAVVLGGAGLVNVVDVKEGASGQLVVTGYYENTVDLDPTVGTNTITATGPENGFVAAFTTLGGYVFGKHLACTSRLNPTGVAADSAGNSYVSGNYEGVANFSGTSRTSAGFQDMFLASYTSTGSLRYVHSFGGGFTDAANAIAADSAGTVFLTGSIGPGADFDPGAGVVASPTTSSYYLASFTSLGALNYVVVEGPEGAFGAAVGERISTRNGKVFTTGTFNGLVDLAPGDSLGKGIVNSDVGFAKFIASFNAADGSPNFARAFGNADTRPFGISSRPDDSVTVVGAFEGVVDFDPGTGVVSRTSVGVPDAFALSLNAQGLLPGTSAQSFEVTNTNDSGAGSLRSVIEFANNTVTRDTITFAIPGAGPHVISPASALPTITAAVVIDGLSQSEASAASWPPDLRIVIDGTSAGVGVSGLTMTSASPEVASSMLRGLVLKGFGAYGISLKGSANDVEVTHCFIGTNVSGTAAVANGLGGVLVETRRCRVGLPDAGNLISGNGGPGVLINGGGGNTLRGNFIGTAANGISALGNAADGVLVTANQFDTTESNVVGGIHAGDGNRIAHNAGDGVALGRVFQSDVLGNSISDNAGLGIDLFSTGSALLGTVNPNDIADADDAEPNERANYPDLRSAIAVGGATGVEGILDGLPGETFRIEFFSNPSMDSSGHGEGKDFLGAIDVDTMNGPAVFSVSLPAVSPGQFISATSTSKRTGIASNEGTSEFSIALPVVTPTVTTVSNSGAGSLSAAIDAANASAGADTITLSPALAGQRLVLTTDLPTITGAVSVIGAPGFVLSGGQNRRPLTVNASGAAVVLSDLVIEGGSASTGGGILISDGNVVMRRCIVRDCVATLDGGGVAVGGGRLEMFDCRITGCSAGRDGGGVAHTAGVFSVDRATLDSNATVGRGGGIFSKNGSILNATLSGNLALTGGGLFSIAGETVKVNFCTIVQNQAIAIAGGVSGDALLEECIVSLNSAPTDPDIAPLVFPAIVVNLVGVNPLMGPLRDNGGFVPTFALLEGSPARDKERPDFNSATLGADARLAPRTNGDQLVDYGAFEYYTAVNFVESPRTYTSWAFQTGAGGPNEDDNGDGLSNFAAHYFGVPVIDRGAGSVTDVGLSTGGDTLIVGFSSPFTVLGAEAFSEVGDGLSVWGTGPVPVEIGSTTARRFYEVRTPVSGPRNFVRIQIAPEP